MKKLLYIFVLFFSTVHVSAEQPKHIYKDPTPIINFLKSHKGKMKPSELKGVDCIYVINLFKRRDKWERVQALFMEQKLTINRFSAVNGWEISKDDLRQMCGPYPVQLTGGEYGCLLSHLSILKDAYDRGYQSIWICEDDIEFLDDSSKISNCLEQLNDNDPDWDVFFTDIRPRNTWKGNLIYVYPPTYVPRPEMKLTSHPDVNQRDDFSEDVARIYYRTGTTSMVISRKGMKKMLDYFTHVYLWAQIDLEMHFIPGIREYTPKTDIVSNWIESESDVLTNVSKIEKKQVDDLAHADLFESAERFRKEKQLPQALKHYKQRISLGDNDDQTFWSKYQAILLEQELRRNGDRYTEELIELAYLFPQRAESLYRLAKHHREEKNYILGYLFSKEGLQRKYSKKWSYKESWVYGWGLLFEYAQSAYHLKRNDETEKAIKKLLSSKEVPVSVRHQIKMIK